MTGRKQAQEAVSLQDAALVIGFSADTLKREIHAHRLPAKKVGGRYNILLADLREWRKNLPDWDDVPAQQHRRAAS